MAAAVADSPHQPVSSIAVINTSAPEDPFVSVPGDEQPYPHPAWYSAFDTQISSLNASSSPSQTKRAIEAHIAETNRRLEDAGRLGSSLVQQRAELAEKLKEVEKRKDDTELPFELRERLAEIERDYNDVGRETARALLAPRSRVVSAEERSDESSPAVLSSHANASPSKVSVPSRKQRNQPSSRAGDIRFYADISTSLLVQVRQLQAALAERDATLKTIMQEKSRLDLEAEGFSQRLRALDESEQRYKDENWNLETQTHELMAAAKEAADREKRLGGSLAAARAEKNRVQNDLDEIRVAHGKLTEDHTAAGKHYDAELHSLRRNLDNVDLERESLHKKVDDLTSQNQELARAIATRSRTRENDADRDLSFNEGDESEDVITPEPSPPPSPTKATPRHGALESETLKSSLHHAHRMIQNLKGNIHREKTEKIELKRMLQDARDELEQRTAESGGISSGSKRQKTKSETFKKPARPAMLGGSRRARTDIEVDEQDWEDNIGDDSPSHAAATRTLESGFHPAAVNINEFSDAYHTANETEGAFETANERGTTESEGFQTGVESFAGESTDESTETETGGPAGRTSTIRANRPSMLGSAAGKRSSYLSTASTSAGEDEFDFRTPVQPQLRYRLKMGRGGNARRSVNQIDIAQRESLAGAQGSPASLSTSPSAAEQSLFAELGEFNGGGSEFSTPGQASVFSSKSPPGAAHMSGRKSLTDSDPAPASELTKMVDSATMTEPWKPEAPLSQILGPPPNGVASPGAGYSFQGHDIPPPSPSDFPLPPSLASSPSRSEMHYTPLRGFQGSPNHGMPSFITPPKTVWDEAHDQRATESKEQIVPSSPPVPAFGFSQASSQIPDHVFANQSEPAAGASVVRFSFSPIISQETTPVEQPAFDIPATTMTSSPGEEQRPSTAHNTAAATSLLNSMGASLGLAIAKDREIVIAEDETSQPQNELNLENSPDQALPFKDISGNVGTTRDIVLDKPAEPHVTIPMSNQGSQTMLTSNQIDDALKQHTTLCFQDTHPTRAPMFSPVLTGVIPRSTSRSRVHITDSDLQPPVSPVKRPSSSSSQQAMTAQHPPLPPDHRNVIAKAGGRLSGSEPESSQGAFASGYGMMGPPLAPASAYRRPRTSTDQNILSPARGGSTPRPTYRERDRARTGSQMSRRSSASSFASELDERFNIRTDGLTATQSFEAGPGTDPRMIQAITQTMIGEFLWKYTRKPGRPEMSNTRHRRYFWVHPYTRTLYWSEQDPQAAGGRELKAKSVAIESVRVVTDDNPMPPGLHRKSLEVVTPGRKVKFTAGTGNRHETWFNALSYLLMRGQDDGMETGNAGALDGGLTADDVDEFNPGGYGRNSRMNRASKLSLSSYNSQTTRGTNQTRASLKQGFPTGTLTTANASASASGHAAATSSTTPITNSERNDPNQTIRQGSISRFSNMFKPSSIRDSFSMSRRSVRHRDLGGTITSISGAQGGRGSAIYNASVVNEGGVDSAEELRAELLRQEREGEGKLENVRACCDGKHDVSDLANGARHRHNHSTANRHWSRDRLAAPVSSSRMRY